MLNSIAPKHLCDIFTKKSTVNATHNLRNTDTDLRLPLRSSAKGQKCFSFRGAKCWNGFSTEAKKLLQLKPLSAQSNLASASVFTDYPNRF